MLNDKKRRAIDEFFKPENLATLKAMFNVRNEQELKQARLLLEDFIDDEGNLDLKKALAFQLDQMGMNQDMLHQAMRFSTKLLGDDIFDEKVDPHIEVEPYCVKCQLPKTKLCIHVVGEERIRSILQIGKLQEALEMIEVELSNTIDQSIWRSHIFLLLHRKQDAYDEILKVETMIHDAPLLQIFKVLIIKLQVLIELQHGNQILDVEDKLKYLTSQLDELDNDEVAYWSGRMGVIAARMAYTRGHMELAVDPLIMAIDCFTQVGAKYELGQSLAQLAIPLMANQEVKRANLSVQYAKQIMRELDNEFGLMQIHHVAVLVQLLGNQHQDAYDELKRARELLDKKEFPEIHITQLLLEAKILANTHQYNKAKVVIAKTKNFVKRIGGSRSKDFLIATLLIEAEMAESEGNINLTRELYDQAANYAVEQNDDIALLEIEANLERLSNLQ